MIPKVIHYIWFGGKPLPAEFGKYLEEWRRRLPGYEIKRWDENNFDIDEYTYAREAYDMGQYAFVGDVARLHILYNHGGIYLDTDIEVLKSFDPFLHNKSFIGYESDAIGTGVIGAEAGTPWLKIFLDNYRKRHFISWWGHPTRTPQPSVLSRVVMPSVPENERPAIYPIDYFCAKDWRDGSIRTTENTVSIHHYANTWKRTRKSLLQKAGILIKGIRTRYLR